MGASSWSRPVGFGSGIYCLGSDGGVSVVRLAEAARRAGSGAGGAGGCGSLRFALLVNWCGARR